MAMITCKICKDEISDSAKFCSNCGKQNTPDASNNNQEKKEVSLLLVIGILLVPYIFSWVTLKKGYSNLSKTVSFSWLILVLMITFTSSPETPISTPMPTEKTSAPKLERTPPDSKIALETQSILKEIEGLDKNNYKEMDYLYSRLMYLNPDNEEFYEKLKIVRSNRTYDEDGEDLDKYEPFDTKQICKAGIAITMSKSPSIVSIDTVDKNSIYLSYLRKDDNTTWQYRCQVVDYRIIWAAKGGRWRMHPDDPVLTFEVYGNSLMVHQAYNDSLGSVKSYSYEQLR